MRGGKEQMMVQILSGIGAAALLLASLLALAPPASAADQPPGARVAAPDRPHVVVRKRIITPDMTVRRRVVRRGYSTPRYWRSYAGYGAPIYGPYYRPWPSYGSYPYLYRTWYGWGGPRPGYYGGRTW
jgi:hypothetical protein